MTTDPLTDFLIARVDEDAQIARFVKRDSPTEDEQFCVWATPFDLDPDRLIVAIDYQRVLADCAAKRRIIEAYLEVVSHESPAYAAAADYMETVVRELASAYADHPDYEARWRFTPSDPTP
jgi:hypothetical protein